MLNLPKKKVFLGKWREASELDMKNVSEIEINKSWHELHILQHKHEYGPIDEIMEVIKMANKSKLLDTGKPVSCPPQVTVYYI
jgi:hypothetical protein